MPAHTAGIFYSHFYISSQFKQAHKSPNFILGSVKDSYNRLLHFWQYSFSYTFVEI